jgi:hypothetical protein
MHNWWIAALEHFGLITRDEAQHISDEIRLSIHKDKYVENFQELEYILGKLDSKKNNVINELENKVLALEVELDKLKKIKVASKK